MDSSPHSKENEKPASRVAETEKSKDELALAMLEYHIAALLQLLHEQKATPL